MVLVDTRQEITKNWLLFIHLYVPLLYDPNGTAFIIDCFFFVSMLGTDIPIANYPGGTEKIKHGPPLE